MKTKTKRAILVVEEAAGKRIRQLTLSEPYPKSKEIYLGIEFDDETETLIEVECVPYFGIRQLVRNRHGELEPVTKPMIGTIETLAKKR